MSQDFFKQQYQGVWAESSARERHIANIIARDSGAVVEFCGKGAGKGAAWIDDASDDTELGHPDLCIRGTNILIEVTGPLRRQRPDAALWINQTKVTYATNHQGDQRVNLVHCNGQSGQIRVIAMGRAFFLAGMKGEFTFVTRAGHKFVAVPANWYGIRTLPALSDYIKEEIA